MAGRHRILFALLIGTAALIGVAGRTTLAGAAYAEGTPMPAAVTHR